MNFIASPHHPLRIGQHIQALSASAALALAMGTALPAAAHPPAAPAKTPADAAAEPAHNGEAMEGMKSMKGMKGMKGMEGMEGMKGMEGMEGMKGMGEHSHGEEHFSFGHPSSDAKPGRIIEINALDTMRFDPPTITVAPGSVIKFVVTNKGEIAHSWSIDTRAEQVEHEEGMQDMAMENMMGHMDGEPNGFVLKPGETKTLTWTFTKGGDIQYACHLPGHYGAGMHGAVMIKGAHRGDHDTKPGHGHGQAALHAHEDH